MLQRPRCRVSRSAAFSFDEHALKTNADPTAPCASNFTTVLARLLVLWAIVDVAPPSQASWAFSLCVSAWALVEVPRYIFYVWKLVDAEHVPSVLTWLRYSLFIPLYPAGIAGEMGCLWFALEHVRDHKVLTVTLPNSLNFVWDHHFFLQFCLYVLYVPAGAFMINVMLQERKKNLGNAKDKRP